MIFFSFLSLSGRCLASFSRWLLDQQPAEKERRRRCNLVVIDESSNRLDFLEGMDASAAISVTLMDRYFKFSPPPSSPPQPPIRPKSRKSPESMDNESENVPVVSVDCSSQSQVVLHAGSGASG